MSNVVISRRVNAAQLYAERDTEEVQRRDLGPDLPNILRQSYDYLTIMRSQSYDRLTTDV